MKYLLLAILISFSQGVFAKEFYEGNWVFDPGLTQKNNPGLNAEGMRITKEGFDKWAGKITMTPKRVKGKKAKMGIPYRVVGRDRYSVWVEVKGGVIGLVKAFRPDLKKMDLRCRIIRVSSNVVAFEVPELQTVKMYLRRVR